VSLPSPNQPFVSGTVLTDVGLVPKVSTTLTWQDLWGTFKVRWGVGRMSYTVEPGLYAIGEVDGKSPVLVTANYKLTFDAVRESLTGLTAWILVVDTKGVNVWCSAGKGTFSTAEVVDRIETSGLAKVVSHRTIILPQLAGPGVAALEVKNSSGFRALYGPIRAQDIKEYLKNGCKATPDMRRKTFCTWERLVLIPVELVGTLKAAAIVAPTFFLLGGISGPSSFWANASTYGLFAAVALVGAIVAGAVVTPLLLPWLPGRAFSTKGLIPGVLAAAMLLGARSAWWGQPPSAVETAAWLLLVTAAATYLAMNFTGASTYTSLSGVKKEMRVAVPLQLAAAVVGILLWIGSRLSA
jgi:hypothetical protein